MIPEGDVEFELGKVPRQIAAKSFSTKSEIGLFKGKN